MNHPLFTVPIVSWHEFEDLSLLTEYLVILQPYTVDPEVAFQLVTKFIYHTKAIANGYHKIFSPILHTHQFSKTVANPTDYDYYQWDLHLYEAFAVMNCHFVIIGHDVDQSLGIRREVSENMTRWKCPMYQIRDFSSWSTGEREMIVQ
jgi:hypothetical protein